MPFVIELGQGRRVWVLDLKVHVMALRIRCRVPALLANVDLIPALLVCIIVCDPVDFQCVRLQRTPLGEGFVTVVAFIRADSCSNIKHDH